MRWFDRIVDERFLEHRRRSTSYAGIVGGVFASLLFAFRYYVNHVWSWDVLAVALVIVGVKVTLMVWYSVSH
jgi:hypothetical protein